MLAATSCSRSHNARDTSPSGQRWVLVAPRQRRGRPSAWRLRLTGSRADLPHDAVDGRSVVHCRPPHPSWTEQRWQAAEAAATAVFRSAKIPPTPQPPYERLDGRAVRPGLALAPTAVPAGAQGRCTLVDPKWRAVGPRACAPATASGGQSIRHKTTAYPPLQLPFKQLVGSRCVSLRWCRCGARVVGGRGRRRWVGQSHSGEELHGAGRQRHVLVGR